MGKITIFKNIYENNDKRYIDIENVFDSIRTGKLNNVFDENIENGSMIVNIRKQSDRNVQQQLKKNLPCILFSGEFENRNDNSIKNHSGFICLDFDKFENESCLIEYRNFLIKDKYTYCVFISPTGNGLKVIVKIPKEIENHRHYFNGLREYYNNENFDISCINIARVCYIGADSKIFINKSSELFKTKVLNVEVKKAVTGYDKIINNLRTWWDKKFGLVAGRRNTNVFILACSFNEFGVPEMISKNYCQQFAQSDFGYKEIEDVVESAYSKTHLFNTQKFEELEKYQQKIENTVEKEEKISLNFKSIYDSSFIDVTKKIERPPVALSIGFHKMGSNYYPTPFGTYGNFSCITGPSKSRKTFFKSLIVAGFIGGTSNIFAPSIKSHMTKGMYVIDIDTEQSEFHAQNVFKRTMRLVGVENYEFYKPFSLRKYEPKERLEFIEWLIYESELKDSIGFISIDGIADLVDDFNDLKESLAMIQKVMKWTQEKQFHLTTILHNNPGSSKPVGHIGTSVLKKAETVCLIENDGDSSKVSFPYCRNFAISEMRYEVNELGLPVVLECNNLELPKGNIDEKPEQKEITFKLKDVVTNDDDFKPDNEKDEDGFAIITKNKVPF